MGWVVLFGGERGGITVVGVSFRHFQFASFHSHGVSFSIIIRYVPQIDRTNLGEPRGSSIVLGEGCFGTCQKMDYRGIAVAVKQFKAHVKASAVRNEASILRQLDHPGEQLSSFASRETEWFVGGGREGSTALVQIICQAPASANYH